MNLTRLATLHQPLPPPHKPPNRNPKTGGIEQGTACIVMPVAAANKRTHNGTFHAHRNTIQPPGPSIHAKGGTMHATGGKIHTTAEASTPFGGAMHTTDGAITPFGASMYAPCESITLFGGTITPFGASIQQIGEIMQHSDKTCGIITTRGVIATRYVTNTTRYVTGSGTIDGEVEIFTVGWAARVTGALTRTRPIAKI